MALLVFIAAYEVVGLVVALVMWRQAHDLFTWVFTGMVLGPLAVPLALVVWGRQHGHHDVVVLDAPKVQGLHLVVGVDGSQESIAAVELAASLLGGRPAEATLVAVVDHETGDGEMPDRLREAKAHLADAARRVPWPTGQVVAAGRPDEELLRVAERTGADLLVLGHRGAGRSTSLLGSTAAALTRNASRPVLLGPGAGRRHGHGPGEAGHEGEHVVDLREQPDHAHAERGRG